MRLVGIPFGNRLDCDMGLDFCRSEWDWLKFLWGTGWIRRWDWISVGVKRIGQNSFGDQAGLVGLSRIGMWDWLFCRSEQDWSEFSGSGIKNA